MNRLKANKMAKILAILIVMAMLLSSLSGLMMPMFYGGSGIYVYGAEDRNSDQFLNEELDFFKQLIKDIQNNYKDDISYGELVDGAYQGLFEALNDPYSEYYIDSSEGDEFVESVAGEFYGIGVSVENFQGQCRVVAPIAGTPAAEAGIQTGDIITKVDGVNVDGKTLSETVALMKGPEGTAVTVTVDRNGASIDFTMNREKIRAQSVFYEMLEDNLGYIQITSFDNDTHLEFREAKVALVNEGAKGLILDVRNNPGGLVGSATALAEQLMPKGPIMHFQQQGEIIETIESKGLADTSLPVVLLINGGSASSSEILAGALKDSGAATLVGTRTYGKGVAQQVMSLKNGASIKLSMYYFLTPNKTVIDKVGVEPHHVVAVANEGQRDALIAQYNSFAPVNEQVKYSSGETGLNVYAVQQRLKMMGYDVAVTSVMDAKTVAAVKQFQKDTGLYAYGGLDLSTAKAVDEASIRYIAGTNGEDVQLAKAIELLK